MDFFKALKTKYPDLKMIAEDLGTNTPEKVKLLEDTGFPGMNVLQFAFTGYGHDSTYLTHKHKPNSVVYTEPMTIQPVLNGWVRSMIMKKSLSENTCIRIFTILEALSGTLFVKPIVRLRIHVLFLCRTFSKRRRSPHQSTRQYSCQLAMALRTTFLIA